MRKLLLLAIAAIAAMAFTSSASAQTVEVHPEDNPTHCGAVTAVNHVVSGGCAVHATTEPGTTANLYQHVPGVGEVLFSLCTNEFEGHINEDGIGFITDQVLAGANCGIEPCDEANHANLEWPVVLWEGRPGVEELATTFCVRSALDAEGTGQSYCSVAVEVNQDPVTHDTEFYAGDPAGLPTDGNSCTDSPVELVGHWVSDPSEGELDIEHIH